MIESGESFELSLDDGKKLFDFQVVACDREKHLYTGYKIRDEKDKNPELSIFYITPDLKQFREVSFMFFSAEERGYGFGQAGDS